MIRKTILAAALLSLPLAAHAEEPVIQSAQKDAAPVERTLTPEQQRLQDILDAGREEVMALAAQLEKAVDQQQRHAIQLQIVAAKQAHRQRFLEEKLAIAQEKGDQDAAQMARRQLDSLDEQINQKKNNVLIHRPTPQEGNR